ncbi:MAG: hypothetical protein NXI10_03605 [bacterium]|nr:hypothetical protein [bacterium]
MKTIQDIVQQIPELLKEAGPNMEFPLLKLLNEHLKQEDDFEESFDLLSQIVQLDMKNVGACMYANYLVYKGYKLRYDQTGSIEDVHAAIDAITLTFRVAQEHRVNVKNPKYYFARAYAYYLLVKHQGKVNESYYRKAYFALKKACHKFNSPSIAWLHDELAGFAIRNDLIFSPIQKA